MVVTFQNRKNTSFQLKPRLVFVHGEVFNGGSKNFAMFKMEPVATIGNGRACNQWTVFACCCSNSIIFTGKIKIG